MQRVVAQPDPNERARTALTDIRASSKNAATLPALRSEVEKLAAVVEMLLNKAD